MSNYTHAEVNRKQVDIMKRELPKLHLQFAVININKALDLISKKKDTSCQ